MRTRSPKPESRSFQRRGGIAFLSLQVMQVGEFTAIVMLTPLLLTVLAAALLGEQVSSLRWLCVLVGFSGAMIVIRPGMDLFQWAMLLPLAWRPLPWAIWGAIGLMGVLSTLGHILLILAYARTPVAVLTPYLYLQIAFAALGGWFVFAHVPDAWSRAGIALVAVGGVFGTWFTGRELLARQRLASPQSTAAAIAGADAN